MGLPARRSATYDDVLTAPPHHRAELIRGALHVAPRPAIPHSSAATALGGDLHVSFGKRRGSSGPGGWWILVEPELHLGEALDQHARDLVLVPDLAGWRRTRLPTRPVSAAIDVVPDWVCEVLSPGSIAHDRVRKLDLYARLHVPHYWIIDPLARTLEVLRFEDGGYRIALTAEGENTVRAEPFDAVEIDLAEWWVDGTAPEEPDAGG